MIVPAKIVIGTHPLVIGRGAGVPCVLQDPSISRRHAELFRRGNCLMLRDLRSRNGTRLNGEAITEAELRDGDRIRLGIFIFEVRGEELLPIERVDGFALHVEHLQINRGGRPLLDDVSFQIAPGQFVGLLGASGAGKSTLLKCLAGYLPPAAGDIRTDDLVLPQDLAIYRRQIGYVPQEDVFYPMLTVRENLDFSLRLRNGLLSPAKRQEEIDLLLKRLQLSRQTKQIARTLSGGQRRRLNVGLDLLGSPKLLFLDEPTSGLDPASETKLMRQLHHLSQNGITIICATHVMENLEKFDQIIILANGEKAYDGPPRAALKKFSVSSFVELYEHLDKRPMSLPRPAGDLCRNEPSRLASQIGLIDLQQATIPKPSLPPMKQVRVLVRRGFRILGRDRWLISLLIGQPLIIGMLINLSQIRPTSLETLFLFAAVTCIWLGLNNTARELVRERPIYRRERWLDVTPEAYLLAKTIVFGTVGAGQVFLLVLIIRWANVLPEQDAEDLARYSIIGMFLVWWVSYLSAMFLGLLVSALSDTQESAVAWLPLIILPQLLLSGVATGLDAGSDRSGAFRSLLLLVDRADEEPRGVTGWLVEGGSLLTFSRPAQVLLQKMPADRGGFPIAVIRLIDVLHLLLLMAATAAVLLAVFHRREHLWLEQT